MRDGAQRASSLFTPCRPSLWLFARREDTKERWKPGALIIVGEDYRLIVADKQDNLAMVSLVEGSLQSGGEEREMALISRWRLVQRLEHNNTRALRSMFI